MNHRRPHEWDVPPESSQGKYFLEKFARMRSTAGVLERMSFRDGVFRLTVRVGEVRFVLLAGPKATGRPSYQESKQFSFCYENGSVEARSEGREFLQALHRFLLVWEKTGELPLPEGFFALKPPEGDPVDTQEPPSALPESSTLHTVLLDLVQPCNQACGFCVSSLTTIPERLAAAHPAPPIERIRDALERIKALPDADMLTLRADDPAYFPGIAEIIRTASKRFKRICLLSPGTRLAEEKFAKLLMDAGLTDMTLPIYGRTEALHDQVTQTPGSHAMLLKAYRHLAAGNVTIRFHTTLIKAVLPEFNSLSRWVVEEQGRELNVQYWYPDRTSTPLHDRYRDLAPPLSAHRQAFGTLPEAILRRMSAINFPYCALPPSALPHIPIRQYDMVEELGRLLTFPPPCTECALRSMCPGLHVRHLDVYGGGEAVPFQGRPVNLP